MLYLGLDIHCKWLTLAGFESTTGECFNVKRIANDPASLAAIFTTLPTPRAGAMEAGTHAVSLHRRLAPYFDTLIIVSPNKVWDRRRDTSAKTDSRDAFKLAEKLANGQLKGIYLPNDALRELRSLLRGEVQLTRERTQLVNQLYAHVRAWGVLVEKKALTKSGRAALGAVTLPGQAARVQRQLLERLDLLSSQLTELEEEIARQVKEDAICRRLMSIPNVGPFTALVLRAEIGDIHRFKSANALINYTGLIPRVAQSGEHTRYGSLTKQGNPLLRYVAVLFAQNITRNKQDTPFKRKFYRLCHAHGPNELKVKIARYFLAVVHSMWQHQADWQWPRPPASRAKASVA